MKKFLVAVLTLALLTGLLITGTVCFAEIEHKGEYPLSDTSEGHVTADGVAAGYWMHPFTIGDRLEVYFDSPIWMVGFRFFAWCPYSDTYLDIELADDKDNVLWTGRAVGYDNAFQEVAFDKSYPPGSYSITFINAENPEYPGGVNQHFVLGSGQVRDDLDPEDIEVIGAAASNSLGAPEIILFEDPDAPTPSPTPEPTATPEPTPEPTPTDEPEVTESPSDGTEDVTEAPDGAASEPEKKSGCGSFAGGGLALTAAAAAIVLIARKKH